MLEQHVASKRSKINKHHKSMQGLLFQQNKERGFRRKEIFTDIAIDPESAFGFKQASSTVNKAALIVVVSINKMKYRYYWLLFLLSFGFNNYINQLHGRYIFELKHHHHQPSAQPTSKDRPDRIERRLILLRTLYSFCNQWLLYRRVGFQENQLWSLRRWWSSQWPA